jgi:hypothetical protein
MTIPFHWMLLVRHAGFSGGCISAVKSSSRELDLQLDRLDFSGVMEIASPFSHCRDETVQNERRSSTIPTPTEDPKPTTIIIIIINNDRNTTFPNVCFLVAFRHDSRVTVSS